MFADDFNLFFFGGMILNSKMFQDGRFKLYEKKRERLATGWVVTLQF